MSPLTTAAVAGSFRDPHSQVYSGPGGVLRALSAEGLADFHALQASGLLDGGRVVPTSELPAPLPLTVRGQPAAAVLEHERVPFVSYPYEWTFSMLQDAALLQLDLILDALPHQLMVKDATPYNVQFTGSRAVFIDVGSFERLRAEELWVGHRQFCMLYLYPLLLQSVKGAAFQPRLRGAVDGITPGEMRGLSSARDLVRRGFATQVFLQARLERRAAARGGGRRPEVRRAELATQVVAANVRKMRKLVGRLRWEPAAAGWVGYGETNSYSAADAKQKADFVAAAVHSRPSWDLVWDLGSNHGRHAEIAAEVASYVVAMDADHGTAELLYRRLREAGDARILPLTVNLADPSPGLGWRGRERAPLHARGRPDLVLALALVHHLAITHNLPLAEVVGWLAELGGAVVVEFPTRDDPMVQLLLNTKRAGLHGDYDRASFEALLDEAFDVRRTEVLGSGTRVLYFATPRRSAAVART